MSGAVRNSCVARGLVAKDLQSTVYTVPESSVLLLKDVFFNGTATSTGSVYIWILARGGADYMQIYAHPWGADPHAEWVGWIALNAGDYIQIQTQASDVRYWISGAVLPYNTPPA